MQVTMVVSTGSSLSFLRCARHFRTLSACHLPRRASAIPQSQASPSVVLPLSEDAINRLSKDESQRRETFVNTKTTSNRLSKLKVSLTTEKGKKTQQVAIQVPVTEDNQYQRLTETVTPLAEVHYTKQLKIKEKRCSNVLKELGHQLRKVKAPLNLGFNKMPCYLSGIRYSPDLVEYRNKDEFGVYFGVDGNPKTVGFYIGRPRDQNMVCVPPTHLVNVKESHKLVAESFQRFIRQSPHEACSHFKKGGVWRSLVVRSTTTGEKMATVIIYPKYVTEEEIQGIMDDLRTYFFEGEGSHCGLDSLYLQACQHTQCSREEAPYQLVAGKEYITETCLDLSFQISPDSFFQINTKGAEVLYKTIMEVAEVSPITTLLDVCCGTGTVSLTLAPFVRGTVGIDVTSGAVEDAKRNAERNNIFNSTFLTGKAEEVLPKLTNDLNECSDVVAVVNPARQGLHIDVINSIRRCEAIQKLIYVSCKPDGDAMKNFVKLCSLPRNSPKSRNVVPFAPKYAVPVDMFPQTNHTELVILFHRV